MIDFIEEYRIDKKAIPDNVAMLREAGITLGTHVAIAIDGYRARRIGADTEPLAPYMWNYPLSLDELYDELDRVAGDVSAECGQTVTADDLVVKMTDTVVKMPSGTPNGAETQIAVTISRYFEFFSWYVGEIEGVDEPKRAEDLIFRSGRMVDAMNQTMPLIAGAIAQSA